MTDSVKPPGRFEIFNTLGRAVQQFVPRTEGVVQLYACGPTVYDYATIGNFRTFILVDVLRRTLDALGYQVRHVMNITDVGHLASDADEGEDKMLAGARREGRTVWDIAQFYTDRFFADADALNILRPDVVAKATDHIDDMIALIRRLEAHGFTYVAGGNVFFDVAGSPATASWRCLTASSCRPAPASASTAASAIRKTSACGLPVPSSKTRR